MFHLFDKNFKNLGPNEFKDEMTGEFMLVDVRTREEFNGGHIKDAINIPLDSIPTRAEEFKANGDKRILLYCLSGARSASAASYLHKLGVENLYNLSGGIMAWSRVFG